jgi:hypothetical protein
LTLQAGDTVGVIMAEKVFVCANCKKLYEYESAVANCRICDEIVCEECMNAEGVCIPCGNKPESEFITTSYNSV